MQAVDYQPRLRWWSHVWRYVVTIALGFATWIDLGIWQWQHNRAWFATDLALGAGCLLLVAWRRRFPLWISLITGAISSISGFASGPATLALVSLSTHRRWREIIPAAGVNLVAALTLDWLNRAGEEGPVLTWPIIIAAIAITVGWGMYIGSRRELLATLRERAETAEAEQAARVVQARTAERARIAREMHDVLAHRISLVTMHAGALTYREDLDADEMRETAAVIQESSHQALVELREVLGILRDDPGDAAPELPQPSAKDVPALLDEARRSGMRIETGELTALDDVPETLGRTLYRVVQEGLTNARKHASDTLVTVDIDGGPVDGISVTVRNPLQVGSGAGDLPASGLGLIGLSERTALAGGRMSHHISAEHEFVLEAWLPWPA